MGLLAWAQSRGHSKGNAAKCLRLSDRTLRHWSKDRRETGVALRPRGRPPNRGTRQQRNEAFKLIRRLGPHIGMPTLRGQGTGLCAAELREMLGRYRCVWQRKQTKWMTRLHWNTPGSVWAMDFTQPDCPVDGQFNRVLVVRDLASGYVLLTQPCVSENSAVVLASLGTLFQQHGAPLVLKSDNGSAFGEQGVQALLHENLVLPLFSPAYYPRYNGACEAGMGSFKKRVKYLAELDVRPLAWTSDDLEHARSQANETARPRGWNKPTPAEAWQCRTLVSAKQRHLLVSTYRQSLAVACAASSGLNSAGADVVSAPTTTPDDIGTGAGGKDPPAPGAADAQPLAQLDKLSHFERGKLDRAALGRALCVCGFLCSWRRRFTPPIRPGSAARI